MASVPIILNLLVHVLRKYAGQKAGSKMKDENAHAKLKMDHFGANKSKSKSKSFAFGGVT